MTACKCGGEIVTIDHGMTDSGKVTDEVCVKCGVCKRIMEPVLPLEYIYVTVKLDEEESE